MDDRIEQFAKQVIETEAAAVRSLVGAIDEGFERAVKLTKEATGRTPNDVKVLFALSRAQLAAGDRTGAEDGHEPAQGPDAH